MKDFKDIQEGILNDIEYTLSTADAKHNKVFKDKLYNYFDIHGRKGKGLIMFFETNNPVSANSRKEFVDMLCDWDDKEPNTIVIDFSSLKKPDALRLYISYGPDLPMIKFIDNKKRKDVLSIKSFQYASLQIVGNSHSEKIDLSKFIHPDTNVSSVQYGNTPYIIYHEFTDNKFPGTVRDGATYCCIFDKIDKNAWPDCQLKFHKDTRTDIFLKSIGIVNPDIEHDTYSGYMVLDK